MNDKEKIQKIQQILKDFKTEINALQARHRKEMETLIKRFNEKKIEEMKRQITST